MSYRVYFLPCFAVVFCRVLPVHLFYLLPCFVVLLPFSCLSVLPFTVFRRPWSLSRFYLFICLPFALFRRGLLRCFICSSVLPLPCFAVFYLFICSTFYLVSSWSFTIFHVYLFYLLPCFAEVFYHVCRSQNGHRVPLGSTERHQGLHDRRARRLRQQPEDLPHPG